MDRKLFFSVSIVLSLFIVVLLGASSFEEVAASSKVTMCHKPGPNQVIIDVNVSAVDAHADHGDGLGGLNATGLVAPADDSLLDNGSTISSDPIVWDFDWVSCGEASLYHLYVQHVGSPFPIIDRMVTESSYHFVSDGYIANFNRFNWEWKVRSFVDGEWGPWSPVRTFDVEPLNSD